MYYQFGWPKTLISRVFDEEDVVQICRHPLKQLIFTLTQKSLVVWHTRFHVVVGCYKGPRGDTGYSSLVIRGDGGCVAISDTSGNLFVLEISFKATQGLHGNPHCPQYQTKVVFGGQDQLRCGCEVSQVEFEWTAHRVVSGGVASIIGFHDYLIVASGSGQLHLMNWLGVSVETNSCIAIATMRVATDLLPQTTAHSLNDEDVTVAQMVVSARINVLVALLSDGKVACFIPTSTPDFTLSSLLGVWIPDVQDGCCVAVNGTYRLIAVGRQNGMVDVFALDESTGAWFISHSLSLPPDRFPSCQAGLGAVERLRWSSGDEMVVAVTWTGGGLAVWSVFGSLLSFSFGPVSNVTPSFRKSKATHLSSLCWAKDGYGLWMASTAPPGENPVVKSGCTLYVLNFLKNAIVNNPTISNHHHILLQGGDRLQFMVNNTLVVNGNRGRTQEIGSAIASTPHWKILQVPESYLLLNWPLRYSCVDATGSWIATAGKAGLALYSCLSRRWKLFSNEHQEQAVVCCGGLVWWRDVVVYPCIAAMATIEVRFYSLHSKLDNSQYLYTLKMMSPIAKINLHGNHLLVLTTNGTLIIYHMTQEVEPKSQGATLRISKLCETALGQNVPRAELAISAMTSSLRAEPSTTFNQDRGCGPEEIESILLNMSGKILMVQCSCSVGKETGRRKVTFGQPVCLASQVEVIWATPPDQDGHASSSHMTQSLWLHCGSSGLKVWLPLFPHDNPHPTFLSKRIMLAAETSLYPQVVLFREVAILGLDHETLEMGEGPSSSGEFPAIFPYSTVERATQLCLHPILRQLLKRNLGAHALQLAEGCCSLPYFPHVLECMLHEVLEEEAPANLPLPDPLLPQVVQFIQHFPQFHSTVSSCARKTEVALWRYLFAAVGKPQDLFETCLRSGNLTTAATYLIIIQNLETAVVSKKLATRLLECALEAGLWDLAHNLIRYLQAIGGGEVSMGTPKSTTPGTPFNVSGPLSSDGVGVTRSPEEAGTEESKSFPRPQFVADSNTRVEYFIDLLLSRHARKLLSSCQLKDLGRFAGQLEFDLVSWLPVERTRAGRVDDFTSHLLSVHKQFRWPLPLPLTPPAPPTRPPADGAPDPTSEFESGNETESPRSRRDDSSGPAPSLSPGSSSMGRSLRPPDLDLKEVSAQQTSPPAPPPQAATEVQLQSVDPLSETASPWQPQYNSSCSDLEQLGNAASMSSDVKDITWLLRLPSKPPEQAEHQLRHLYRALREGLWLEGCLLIAVVLQDIQLLNNMAANLDELISADVAVGTAVAKQLIHHISTFLKWAAVDCPGYSLLEEPLTSLSSALDLTLTLTHPNPPEGGGTKQGGGEPHNQELLTAVLPIPTSSGSNAPKKLPSPASSPASPTPDGSDSTACIIN